MSVLIIELKVGTNQYTIKISEMGCDVGESFKDGRSRSMMREKNLGWGWGSVTRASGARLRMKHAAMTVIMTVTTCEVVKHRSRDRIVASPQIFKEV